MDCDRDSHRARHHRLHLQVIADAEASPLTTKSGSMRVLIMGPPASGKGTHGKRLAVSLGLDYLSTGALLRKNMEQKTPLGLAAAPILARGGYLPDHLMSPILGDWLENHKDGSGWVLDGFPRSLPQAEFLDNKLNENGSGVDAAIALEVPFSELIHRIRDRVECTECRWTGQRDQLAHDGKCPICAHPAGPRADDDEENFRKRHAAFEFNTLPVIARYRASGKLISIFATLPKDQVAAAILNALRPQSEPSTES